MPRPNTISNSLTTTRNKSLNIFQIRRVTNINHLPSLILRSSSLTLQSRRNNNQEQRLILTLTLTNLRMTRQIHRNKRLGRKRVAFKNAHVKDLLVRLSLLAACIDSAQFAREAAEHGHACFGGLAAWAAICVAVEERGDGAVLQCGVLVC